MSFIDGYARSIEGMYMNIKTTPVKVSTPNKIVEITPRPKVYDQRMLLRLTLTGCRWKKMLLVIVKDRSMGLSGRPCRKNDRHTRDWVRKLQRVLVWTVIGSP